MWNISDARDSWATDTGRDLLASIVVSAQPQIRLTFGFGFRPKVPLYFRGTYGFGRMWYVTFGLLLVTAESGISTFGRPLNITASVVSQTSTRCGHYCQDCSLRTLPRPLTLQLSNVKSRWVSVCTLQSSVLSDANCKATRRWMIATASDFNVICTSVNLLHVTAPTRNSFSPAVGAIYSAEDIPFRSGGGFSDRPTS